MYCSSCGAESTPGLNYCNRCGASLVSQAVIAAPSVSLTKPIVLFGATVVLLTLSGFAALVKGATELARNEFGKDPVMAMIMMGMLTILIIDMMLIRQLSRLVSASIEACRSTSPARQKEIAQPRQTSRQLRQARPEPIPSVTENTTRTFKPVYRESNR